MDVSTLTISGEEAARKVRIYGAIPEANRTEEDEYLLRVYRAVGKGKRILDVGRAFRETGLHANGYPKLAIAAAGSELIYFHPRVCLDSSSSWFTAGAGGFSPRSVWDRRAVRMNFALPLGTFDNEKLVHRSLRSQVPHIPPELRPSASLGNYHILFEAEWTTYPIDPYLVRHVTGMLFVVEAEWELTELETSLLAAMHST